MNARQIPSPGAFTVDPPGNSRTSAAVPKATHQGSSLLLRLLFAIPVILLPNALHVPIGTGIPGINTSNLLFLVLVGALLIGRRETAPTLAQAGRLTPPLVGLFLALTVAFVIAQRHDMSNALDDLTALKNAIFYPLFYFVYRRCRQDLHGTRQLIALVLLVAAIAGLTAIFQGVQFGLGSYDSAHRATGPFGAVSKANRAGVFYAMFLPMFAAIAVLSERKKLRMAALVGCVVLAVAILFTYSRQSYLIALVGLLILLMHRSVIAAILAGVLLLMSVNMFPESVIERVQETRQTDARGNTAVDNSTTSRVEIWEGAIDMWRDHPAGVGLGRFQSSIGEYSRHRGRDAHNSFVLVLAEAGALGLAAMTWLFWRLWGLSRRLRRSAAADDPEGRALALGFSVTLVSMFLGNVFGSPFFDGLVMANFWILCGLLERYGALKAQAAMDTDAAQEPSLSVTFADRFPLTARTMPGIAATPGPRSR